MEKVYKEVGHFMQFYTAGKFPQAFKIIPRCLNWQELVKLTQPSKWSVHAMKQATTIFVSNSSSSHTIEVFFREILLESVRNDIQKHKHLNVILF